MILAAILTGIGSAIGIIGHGLWLARRDRLTERAAGKAPQSLDWAAIDAQRAESVERAQRQADLDRDFEEFDRQLSPETYAALHPQPPAPPPYVVKPNRPGERVISNAPGAMHRIPRGTSIQEAARQLGHLQQVGLEQQQLTDEERAQQNAGLQNQQPPFLTSLRSSLDL